MRILLIDNYDSFTHNLSHQLAVCSGMLPDIVAYHALPGTDLQPYDLAVISPGPGHPFHYPDYRQLLHGSTPTLGICLGMQIINNHFGGTTVRLDGCIHGKTDNFTFLGHTVTVARYHSLHVEKIGEALEVLAVNHDGVPMALKHRSKAMLGYQFHPESFLTDNGNQFIHKAFDLLGLS